MDDLIKRRIAITHGRTIKRIAEQHNLHLTISKLVHNRRSAMVAVPSTLKRSYVISIGNDDTKNTYIYYIESIVPTTITIRAYKVLEIKIEGDQTNYATESKLFNHTVEISEPNSIEKTNKIITEVIEKTIGSIK